MLMTWLLDKNTDALLINIILINRRSTLSTYIVLVGTN